MGFRFRRRLRILPGLWFNVSKSGVSTSIGGHGATLNLSKRGTRITIGLPGSGLSYRSPTKPWAEGGPANDSTPDVRSQSGIWLRRIVLAAIIVGIMGWIIAGR